MKARRIALAIVLATVLFTPLVAEGQQSGKVPRIGILFSSNPTLTAYLLEAFKQGLREHGYVEGQSVIVERRYAEVRLERLSDLARELVRLKVDVIVAATDVAIQAVQQHTQSIPIVMVASGDPVGAGFVVSLARPGGNITGLSQMAPELAGKRVELLREIIPSLSRLAFLGNPEVAGAVLEHNEIETAARRFKMHLQYVEVRRNEDIDNALSALVSTRPGAALLQGHSNPVLFANRSRITGFAAERRLPIMYGVREYVDAGGLIAYGPSVADLYRRPASFVDKILKGAKPADLPVEQPTKFELVINLKTAKALGLTIPQSLLLRADQVVE